MGYARKTALSWHRDKKLGDRLLCKSSRLQRKSSAALLQSADEDFWRNWNAHQIGALLL